MGKAAAVTMGGPVAFARRPGELYERLAWAVIPLVAVLLLLWRLAGFIIMLLSDRSGLATGARLMALPLIALSVFMLYLIVMGVRTFRRAFTHRDLPLVVLDGGGVTLNRTNPVTVPWADITDASLERGMRGATTLLRLNVRDPGVQEMNANGRIIDLRALAVPLADLLAAIRSCPRFQPSSLK